MAKWLENQTTKLESQVLVSEIKPLEDIAVARPWSPRSSHQRCHTSTGQPLLNLGTNCTNDGNKPSTPPVHAASKPPSPPTAKTATSSPKPLRLLSLHAPKSSTPPKSPTPLSLPHLLSLQHHLILRRLLNHQRFLKLLAEQHRRCLRLRSQHRNFTGCLTLHAETQQCKHYCFTAGLASKMGLAIRADLAQVLPRTTALVHIQHGTADPSSIARAPSTKQED
ncbi:hypothetical protein MSG28_009148 [Choristoneura fumiferana]|uniref:Uncharacterized protein n=1 Tax=Choristoneura fumiferana TaxID=7141 RepID=A0ACC0KXF8_CHOFU|nr:hypothetical protein MSG28_009148 [Choristoneura fumiferana]